TLLVDLEQRRPLDLLPNRDATSVANWLTGNRAIRAIARITALDRRTVRHWINAGGFPERAQRPPAASKLEPYRAYLAQRWREGCPNSARLYREIVG
ncbi:ISL3 family transposase, partial [Mycetohabitans sp. B8]|nr:ISL3 family transposase [Mycetohabitans sp. B8]